VIVTVVAVLGTTLLLNVAGRDPVGWVKQRWYDLRGETEVISDVVAEAVPPDSVASSYSVEGVVDSADVDAWAATWNSDTAARGECDPTEYVGKIRLILKDATRVRGLDVWPGVAAAGDRGRQFRPRRLDVSFDGKCITEELDDKPGPQRVDFDTGGEVDSITIAVGSAYAPKTAPPRDLVAIGRIDLLRRPE
jgi:hypothetical protein